MLLSKRLVSDVAGLADNFCSRERIWRSRPGVRPSGNAEQSVEFLLADGVAFARTPFEFLAIEDRYLPATVFDQAIAL